MFHSDYAGVLNTAGEADSDFGDGGRPVPAEHRQRLTFERYFAAGTKSDTERSRQSLGRSRSCHRIGVVETKGANDAVNETALEKLNPAVLEAVNQHAQETGDVGFNLERHTPGPDAGDGRVDVGALLSKKRQSST